MKLTDVGELMSPNHPNYTESMLQNSWRFPFDHKFRFEFSIIVLANGTIFSGQLYRTGECLRNIQKNRTTSHVTHWHISFIKFVQGFSELTVKWFIFDTFNHSHFLEHFEHQFAPFRRNLFE